jgi:TrmH family RNA methyltransferase
MKIKEEIITSKSNLLVKWLVSLSDKKGRTASKSFFVEGEKLSFEALKAKLPATHVIIRADKANAILPKIKPLLLEKEYEFTEIILMEDKVFSKISTEKAPQGIITVIKYLDFFQNLDIIYKEDFFLKDDEKALILCSLQDPGNLGSVIRSAVAFGVEHIILSSDSADLYNPKTVRSAMGSLYRIKASVVKSLSDFIIAAKASGRRVLAAELSDDAVSLDKAELKPSDIVMIGNEGHGIPKELSALCDNSVYIPISEKTESLNASVAAAIFMWEQGRN